MPSGIKINELPRAAQVSGSNLIAVESPAGTGTEAATVEQLRDYVAHDALEAISEAAGDAVEAVEEKGAETLASIPEDYTKITGDVADLKSASMQFEDKTDDDFITLVEDGVYRSLNPLNLISDPTFSKGEWGANNLTLTYSDREGTLSKVCTGTRINTSKSGYLEYIFPVSLFENGKTYRVSISIATSYNSQILAIKQNINGQYGNPGNWIVTDASMTKDYQSSSHSDFHYDWTVNTSSFGTYNYVQIGFKVTNNVRPLFEPFVGLSTADTDYQTEYDMPVSFETLYPVNLFNLDGYYPNKFWSSNTSSLSDQNGCNASKGQFLKAGSYVYYFRGWSFYGTSAPYYYVLSSADATSGTRKTATKLSENDAWYTFTITEDSYVAFNIGTSAVHIETFMVAVGSTLADCPVGYHGYFEPYEVVKKTARMNPLMLAENSPIYGKKVAVNGDSICAGEGSVGGFMRPVAVANNMSWQNLGVSGATLASGTQSGGTNRHWVSTSIQNMPADYDYYIFEGGVNDFANRVTLGELTTGFPVKNAEGDNIDSTTVIGAVEYACRDLVTIFPGKKYGFLFVHGIFGYTGGNTAWHEDYKPGIISALKKWGVPFLDLEEEVPPLNLIDSLKSVYTKNGDGWHPNDAGYAAFYTSKIARWMESL